MQRRLYSDYAAKKPRLKQNGELIVTLFLPALDPHALEGPASLIGSPLVRDKWPGGTQGTPQRQLVKYKVKIAGKDLKAVYG